MCQDNMKVVVVVVEQVHLVQILLLLPAVLAVLVNQILSLDHQFSEPVVAVVVEIMVPQVARVVVEQVLMVEQQQQEQLTLEAEVVV
jgi:hypothetical protein